MYWHIDADIISLIVITIVFICNHKLPAPDAGSIRSRRFNRCLVCGILITLVDIAASLVMEVPTGRLCYHLMMTAYFSGVELVIVEWFLYVLTILYQDYERERQIAARIIVGLYLLYAVFTCTNPWTGLIYSLGPQNQYSRGPLFFVMLALYAFYTLALFALIIIRWQRIPREFPSSVLMLTPVIIAVGIVAQLLLPGWLLIIPAYMICLVLAFLFLQTMRVRSSQQRADDLALVAETDKLTGLYNRLGLEVMVQRTLAEARGQTVLVLIADIDDLKAINDGMGHAEGDRSIRLVAEQLKRHFRAGDTVARYGGDEFLAFLTGSFTEEQMHLSLQRLIEELNRLRIGRQNDVPLQGSVGAALGRVGDDSFEELCSQADTALYYVKRNGKNGYALYRPDMEQE